MAPLWVKIDVDMLLHPKLFGRPAWQRILWLGLICIAKKHFAETGVIENLGPAELNSIYNLGVNEKDVEEAIRYFAKVGMVRIGKDGAVALKDFLERQRDPTNAMRQAAFRGRRNGSSNANGNGEVTPEVTRGALPEGEGEEEIDLDPTRGGDPEASQTLARKNAPLHGKPKAQEPPSVKQLESDWPSETLRELRGHSRGVDGWLKFLHATANFDEAVRVAAARKFLAEYVQRGKKLDYLAGMIKSMAAEQRPGGAAAASADLEYERIKREGDAFRKKSAELDKARPPPEERKKILERMRAERAAPVKNGAHKPAEG